MAGIDDPTIGFFKVALRKFDFNSSYISAKNGNTNYGFIEIDLKYSRCNQSNFWYKDWGEQQTLQFSNYFCIDDIEMIELNSLYLQSDYSYLVIDYY